MTINTIGFTAINNEKLDVNALILHFTCSHKPAPRIEPSSLSKLKNTNYFFIESLHYDTISINILHYKCARKATKLCTLLMNNQSRGGRLIFHPALFQLQVNESIQGCGIANLISQKLALGRIEEDMKTIRLSTDEKPFQHDKMTKTDFILRYNSSHQVEVGSKEYFLKVEKLKKLQDRKAKALAVQRVLRIAKQALANSPQCAAQDNTL